MVKYTEQECVAFNSLLHDYLRIDSDSDGKWRVTYQEGQLYKACPAHSNGQKGRDKWQK